ncbi:anthranilate phosphoribosyltransferase, partial [bacterium]|nr:anthranilate phosphoribosyltransferase [bacterium]
GIAFLFAPKLHMSMKYAIGPRRELGIRTFFNILGPMTNPARANRQLIGVYSQDLVEKVAGVLAKLGSVRAFVVHGSDGLDEITSTGTTTIAEVRNGAVAVFECNPEDFGIGRAAPESLTGGDAAENAKLFLSVLNGEKGPQRDVVLMNSAFAICAGGKADSPAEGFELAKQSIDSGAAMKKLDALKEFTVS